VLLYFIANSQRITRSAREMAKVATRKMVWIMPKGCGIRARLVDIIDCLNVEVRKYAMIDRGG
jgi:hypothetical protein